MFADYKLESWVNPRRREIGESASVGGVVILCRLVLQIEAYAFESMKTEKSDENLADLGKISLTQMSSCAFHFQWLNVFVTVHRDSTV